MLASITIAVFHTLFNLLGISAGGLIGRIITATAGAAVLLFAIDFIKKR